MRPFVIALVASTVLHSEDWPRFRGPNGSGIAASPGPVQFADGTNMLWRGAVPPGYSSPVVYGGRVFLTALDAGEFVTIALDAAKGREVWRRTLPRTRQEKLHKLNHPASPSAAVGPEGVFVFFPDFGLAAYSLAGEEKWRVPLGPFHNVYGMGVSPVLAAGRVILVCDQGKGSYIAAFSTADGEQVWKSARSEAVSGHSTPIVHDGLVLAPGSFRFDAYDAATGRLVWWTVNLPSEMKSVPVIDGDTVFIHGFNTPENDPGRLISVPPFPQSGRFQRDQAPTEHSKKYFAFLDLDSDGWITAAEWAKYGQVMGAENGMFAIRLGGQGDVTVSHTRWKFQRSIPQLPSPLVYRGVVYMINEAGILTTLDAATGKVHRQARLRGEADTFYASPIAAGDKIYFSSYTGVVTVLEAGPDHNVAAVNRFDGQILGTPAIADGVLYLRVGEHLYAFAKAMVP